MTTLKRIMAVVLAVMLVASIAVFSASAATENTLEIKGKENYKFDVYKIASFKGETTGGYDIAANVPDSVKTFINTADTSNAGGISIVNGVSFLKTLDDATFPTSFTTTTIDGDDSFTTTDAGIYYVKFNEYTGPGEAKITKNSVIVWPEYVDGAWDYNVDAQNVYTVDLGNKTSSEYITKYFSEDTTLTVGNKVVAQGDEVDFTLEANIAGSADNKLATFEIWDKMSAGLQYKDNSVKFYYDAITSDNETSDFTMTSSAIDEDTAYGGQAADSAYNKGTLFKVTASSNVLAGTSFYGHTKVYVTYTAIVKNTAKTGSAGNPNKDALILKYASDSEPQNVPGRQVTVFTASLKATKINGNTNAALEGATFALYKVEGTTETQLATGVSGADGNIIFKKDSADTESIKLGVGSYKVVETAAAPGFAKTTAAYTFSIDENYAKTGTAIFEVKDSGKTGICNYPTKLPETGGMGTTLFYVIGGCLVLFAGAMFVVIMRKKKTSSK